MGVMVMLVMMMVAMLLLLLLLMRMLWISRSKRLLQPDMILQGRVSLHA